LDGFVCKFDSNNNKLWGTYYGGEGNENNIRFHPYDNGTKFYIVGITNSQNEIATPGSYQPAKSCFDCINNTPDQTINIFFTHFEPAPLSNPDFNAASTTIYPNPANTAIRLLVNSKNNSSFTIEFYDLLGKKVLECFWNNTTDSIDVSNMSAGIYMVKITNENKESVTQKLIITN